MLGGADLDQLLAERERLNEHLQRIVDEQTEPWGIKVSTVEIKDVEIPEAMQRAMARQAEAERERRAKIINADGEFQAAEKLAGAASILAREPTALQLRYLQTLLEVGADQNSTIVFPLPLDLLKPFLERAAPRPQQALATASPRRDAALRRIGRGAHRSGHQRCAAITRQNARKRPLLAERQPIGSWKTRIPPMIAVRLAATDVSAMTSTPSPIWRLRAEA